MTLRVKQLIEELSKYDPEDKIAITHRNLHIEIVGVRKSITTIYLTANPDQGNTK